MIEPFPSFDVSELPITFLACTVAHTLVPQGKLYGLAVTTLRGIEQVIVLITVNEVPSQYAFGSEYVFPSDYRTFIV
jgi:hypothetical protein